MATSRFQLQSGVVEYIDVNPDVCGGKPVIRGTRIMVKNILGIVGGGYSLERILESYPELKREEVLAAIEMQPRN